MYNNLYDLIIADIMMPGIDGFDFAETVRRVNKTVPILFISARDDMQAKGKGLALGIAAESQYCSEQLMYTSIKYVISFRNVMDLKYLP